MFEGRPKPTSVDKEGNFKEADNLQEASREAVTDGMAEPHPDAVHHATLEAVETGEAMPSLEGMSDEEIRRAFMQRLKSMPSSEYNEMLVGLQKLTVELSKEHQITMNERQNLVVSLIGGGFLAAFLVSILDNASGANTGAGNYLAAIFGTPVLAGAAMALHDEFVGYGTKDTELLNRVKTTLETIDGLRKYIRPRVEQASPGEHSYEKIMNEMRASIDSMEK